MQTTAETILRTAARISHRTDPGIPARTITGTATGILTEIPQKTAAETAPMTATTAAAIIIKS